MQTAATLRPAIYGTQSENTDSLTYCCTSIDRAVSAIFGWYGYKVSLYPFTFIGLSFLFVTVCCFGYWDFSLEPSSERLYTPYNTGLFEQRAYIEQRFGYEPRPVNIIVDSYNSNIFNPTVIWSLFDIYDTIRTTSIAFGNGTYDYNTLCYKPNTLRTTCDMISILDYWNYNRDQFLNDTSIASTLMNGQRNRIGRMIVPQEIYSGNTETVVLSILAYRIQFYLNYNPKMINNEVDDDLIAKEWELQLQRRLNTISWTIFPKNTRVSLYNPNLFTNRTTPSFPLSQLDPQQLVVNMYSRGQLKSELDSAFDHDRTVIALSYVLVWVLLVGIYMRRNFIRSRMGLSFATILTVILAFVSCIGAGSGMKYQFNWSMIMLSFFILVLACNQISVLMTSIIPFTSGISPFALTNYHSHHSFWWIQRFGVDIICLENGISVGVAAAGPFISTTCLATFVSLLTGAYTVLAGFRAFCIFAALGVLFLFILIFTFFLPCLILDARRQSKKKADILCCCPVTHPFDAQLCSSDSVAYDENDSSVLGAAVSNLYTSVLLHPIGMLIAVFITGTVLAASIYGLTIFKIGISDHELIPKQSYLHHYVNVRDRYFAFGETFEIVTRENDYFVSQTGLDALYTGMISSPYVDLSSINSWYNDYSKWLRLEPSYTNSLSSSGKPISPLVFYSSLYVFLQTDRGRQYQEDIIFNNINDLPQGIKCTRLTGRFKYYSDDRDGISTMTSFRTLTLSVSATLPSFIFTQKFFDYETYDVLQWEVIRNFIIGISAVLFMLLCLLANFWCSLLVISTIIVLVVDILGIMSLLHLPFNMYTGINLLCIIGLSVDFTTHIVHGFMRTYGTRQQRTIRALQVLGGGIFDYGWIIFGSVLSMSAGMSYMVFTYFTYFSIFAIIGVWHGIVVLPIACSLIGPEPYALQPATQAFTVPLHGTEMVGIARETGDTLPLDANSPSNHTTDRDTRDSNRHPFAISPSNAADTAREDSRDISDRDRDRTNDRDLDSERDRERFRARNSYRTPLRRPSRSRSRSPLSTDRRRYSTRSPSRERENSRERDRSRFESKDRDRERDRPIKFDNDRDRDRIADRDQNQNRNRNRYNSDSDSDERSTLKKSTPTQRR